MNEKTIRKLWWSGFGVGFIPWAPGTFGTLLAFPLYFFLKDFWPFLHASVLTAYIALSLIFLQREINVNKDLLHDRPHFICDEVAGMWLALILIKPNQAIEYVLCFILFRFFDIIKPFPIDYVDEKIKGSVGVMIDDLFASFYTALAFHFLIVLYQRFGSLFI